MERLEICVERVAGGKGKLSYKVWVDGKILREDISREDVVANLEEIFRSESTQDAIASGELT